ELYYSADPEHDGITIARAAIEMSERLGDPALLAQTLHGFVVAAKVPEQTAAMLDASRRLVGLGREGVPDDLDLTGRGDGLRRPLRMARVADFADQVDELVAIAERRRDPTLRTLLTWAEATAAFFAGDLMRAEARALDAAERHERSGAWGSPEALSLHMD